MNVREIMTANVACCRADDTMDRAAKVMWDYDCGAVPVIDEAGKPIAMITDRDIAMAAYTQGRPLWAIPVSVAMSKTLVTCGGDETVGIAESLMRSQQVRRLPVVDADGFIIGILSLNDIATHCRAKPKTRAELSGDSIASTLAAICSADRTSRLAAE